MHEHVSRALLCRVPLENIAASRGPYYDSVKFCDPYFERVSEIYEDNNYDEYDSHDSSRYGDWFFGASGNIRALSIS